MKNVVNSAQMDKACLLEKWKFGEKSDELIGLVLTGKKTATTYTYDEKAADKIGEFSIITFSNGKNACTVRTKGLKVMKFGDMTWGLAKLEGENNNLNDWRNEHLKFFKTFDSTFDDNSKIIFEIFEIVY